MKKYISSLIIGCAIIIGFTILGLFWSSSLNNETSAVVKADDEYKYELISASENNIIIFDKSTGEYWNKFIPSNEGPTEWEKGDFPIGNNEQ